ncbi:hypothetical protein V6M93_04465 [Pectobacterium brasiliense]|uniref:hypothetical protein n=1 Tax=Pectobacterium brasiliense TaxID=180957 RepID=UPI002A81F63F|nr:hypothetical protein [Pectobacterium brasiliense]MDY4367733.1 hypothetical protein [Pectobacterium brasiliense]MDY7057264.1 hypothetical protein [Pectobacterium brasiliense]
MSTIIIVSLHFSLHPLYPDRPHVSELPLKKTRCPFCISTVINFSFSPHVLLTREKTITSYPWPKGLLPAQKRIKAELLTVHIQKISSYPDVFANAQPIVKAKQRKSEETARLDKPEPFSEVTSIILLMNVADFSAICHPHRH